MPLAKQVPSFDLSQYYEEEWGQHHHTAKATQNVMFSAFSEWVDISSLALQQGKKLLFFGNGGSAADAQHLATELTVRFKKSRKALPALALTTDTSALG